MPNRFSSDPQNKDVYDQISDSVRQGSAASPGEADTDEDKGCGCCGRKLSATSSDVKTAIPSPHEPGCFTKPEKVGPVPSLFPQTPGPGRYADVPSKVRNDSNSCGPSGCDDEGADEEDDDQVSPQEHDHHVDFEGVRRTNSLYADFEMNDTTRAKKNASRKLGVIRAVSSQYVQTDLYEVRIATSDSYCLSCRRPECIRPNNCLHMAKPAAKVQRPTSSYALHPEESKKQGEQVQTTTVKMSTITRVSSLYCLNDLHEERVIDQKDVAYKLRAQEQKNLHSQGPQQLRSASPCRTNKD